MKYELSIQTYSVRDHMGSISEISDTFCKLSSYGYTGIQTAGDITGYAEEYAAAAEEHGLKIIGTHMKMDVLRDTDRAVKIHKILGTTNAGIGAMPAVFDENISKKNIDEFILDANAVAEKFGEYGLNFTYHHHAAEFAKIGNETIMEILVRELDQKNISFVLDTYWLQKGGVSILEWIYKLGGRVDILHLKDMYIPAGGDEGCMTELGAGNINFKDVIRAADETGVKHLCYEQDGNHKKDSLLSAKQSAEYFFEHIQ